MADLNMWVHTPGTMCNLGAPDGPEALITKATITIGGAPYYEVVWWNGRERKEQYVYDKEIYTRLPPHETKQHIGFHPPVKMDQNQLQELHAYLNKLSHWLNEAKSRLGDA